MAKKKSIRKATLAQKIAWCEALASHFQLTTFTDAASKEITAHSSKGLEYDIVFNLISDYDSMQRSTKIALVVIIALLTISTLLSLAVNRIGARAQEGQYIDEYGWEHGAKSSGIAYNSDENLSRTYALVEYDKEKMSQWMRTHL